MRLCPHFFGPPCISVVRVDRRIRWHYTTTILRLRIGARLTRYRNCKFLNFARTISRHADGISRYSVPPSAGPLLPQLYIQFGGRTCCACTALQRKAGHFTQCIWKGSREIGIGRAFADKGRSVYVVCNYFPAGNVIGHLRDNVLPAI